MTVIDLARIIAEMRSSQKAYFKSRTMDLLEESKRKEREVDKLVREIIEDRPGMLAGFDTGREDA